MLLHADVANCGVLFAKLSDFAVVLCFGKNKACRVLIALGGLCFGFICSTCAAALEPVRTVASCHVTHTEPGVSIKATLSCLEGVASLVPFCVLCRQ